jgi:hypothetical protein
VSMGQGRNEHRATLPGLVEGQQWVLPEMVAEPHWPGEEAAAGAVRCEDASEDIVS